MSQGSSVASGLVRVTIASGSRRVDLVLPGAIPVAELVPELARSVGLLDASTVYGGYRLVTQEGRILANDASLTMQGIEDGGLLTVTAGVDDKAPRVYDDVVGAMADVVENELKPWEPAAGRRTAQGAGSILLGLGALALVVQGESLLGGVAAAVVAGLLVVGAPDDEEISLRVHRGHRLVLVGDARGVFEVRAAPFVELFSRLHQMRRIGEEIDCREAH